MNKSVKAINAILVCVNVTKVILKDQMNNLMVSEMKLQFNEQRYVLDCIKESICDNNERILSTNVYQIENTINI